MNDRLVISLQIDALKDDLTHVEYSLNTLPNLTRLPHTHSTHLDLIRRVRPRFDYLIQTQRTALAEVETYVVEGRPAGDCWKALRRIRLECKRLFQACLALIEGVLVRQHGLDGGLCRIADGMLDELNLLADTAWRRFTIWADGESFANLDEVISLRFPSLSIWHLPLIAHEFGHFVSQNLEIPGTSRHPFDELCQDHRESDESPFLPEYFSDIFAVYSVGPAYLCACILLRFDHGAACFPGPEHPSDVKRVHAMLRVLKAMDKHPGSTYPSQYGYVLEKLEDIWRQGLAATLQQADIGDEAAEKLDEIVDEIYAIMAHDLPPDVRYSGWLRAQRLVAVLSSFGKLNLDAVNDDDSIIDVVNAAWLSRLLNGDSQATVRDFSRDALEMCNHILARPKKV